MTGATPARRPRAILPRLGLPRGPWNTPRPDDATLAAESALLPERADVWWRPLLDERELDAYARAWTATMALHVVVFLLPGLVLLALEPWTFPIALMCAGWAWVVPDLYASRGAKVVRPKPTRAGAEAEQRSLGMLGDLLGHEARALHAATGLVLERGTFGVWLRRRRRGAAACARAGASCTASACACPTRASARRPHRAPAARAAR